MLYVFIILTEAEPKAEAAWDEHLNFLMLMHVTLYDMDGIVTTSKFSRFFFLQN